MSFLGVPSGLVLSKMSLFLNPTTSFTVSASFWMVISLPEPICVAFGSEATTDSGTHHAFVAGYVDF